MGYFLDYENFEPCWFCGRTDCNGNHTGPAAEAAARRITHDSGDRQNCPCENCRHFRELAASREARKAVR